MLDVEYDQSEQDDWQRQASAFKYCNRLISNERRLNYIKLNDMFIKLFYHNDVASGRDNHNAMH